MRKFKEEEFPWKNPIQSEKTYNIYKDGYPVTDGHLLFVPMINSDTLIAECFTHALHYGTKLVKAGECDDFNVGYNSGPSAGRTVDWPHVHLIPRRHGDVDDPTGGVRGVIHTKQNYRNG